MPTRREFLAGFGGLALASVVGVDCSSEKKLPNKEVESGVEVIEIPTDGSVHQILVPKYITSDISVDMMYISSDPNSNTTYIMLDTTFSKFASKTQDPMVGRFGLVPYDKNIDIDQAVDTLKKAVDKSNQKTRTPLGQTGRDTLDKMIKRAQGASQVAFTGTETPPLNSEQMFVIAPGLIEFSDGSVSEGAFLKLKFKFVKPASN